MVFCKPLKVLITDAATLRKTGDVQSENDLLFRGLNRGTQIDRNGNKNMRYHLHRLIEAQKDLKLPRLVLGRMLT